MQLAPGDPLQAYITPQMHPEDIERIRIIEEMQRMTIEEKLDPNEEEDSPGWGEVEKVPSEKTDNII